MQHSFLRFSVHLWAPCWGLTQYNSSICIGISGLLPTAHILGMFCLWICFVLGVFLSPPLFLFPNFTLFTVSAQNFIQHFSSCNFYSIVPSTFHTHLMLHQTITLYTAIFLTNGLCIAYCSLPQCLTLVYPGWGQKSEFFCLLVTTRRLRSGTVVGYCSTTVAYCWYTAAKGH